MRPRTFRCAQGAERLERGRDVVRREPALRRLVRDVDLEQHARDAVARAALELTGQVEAVDRVDEVEQLERVADLVRLQVADQVPRNGPAQDLDLVPRLLDPVLAEAR